MLLTNDSEGPTSCFELIHTESKSGFIIPVQVPSRRVKPRRLPRTAWFLVLLSVILFTQMVYAAVLPANGMVQPFAPDYSITVSPSTLTLGVGINGNVVITLTSLSGFSGTVSLSANVSSAGPTPVLAKSALVLTSGGTSATSVEVFTAYCGPCGTQNVPGANEPLFRAPRLVRTGAPQRP